jgi:hypothetical protein
MSEKYKNRGGNSGIDLYELRRGAIAVTFNDGSEYLYTRAATGKSQVAYMRRLAIQGEGLNSYINRRIGTGYESKS